MCINKGTLYIYYTVTYAWFQKKHHFFFGTFFMEHDFSEVTNDRSEVLGGGPVGLLCVVLSPDIKNSTCCMQQKWSDVHRCTSSNRMPKFTSNVEKKHLETLLHSSKGRFHAFFRWRWPRSLALLWCLDTLDVQKTGISCVSFFRLQNLSLRINDKINGSKDQCSKKTKGTPRSKVNHVMLWGQIAGWVELRSFKSHRTSSEFEGRPLKAIKYLGPPKFQTHSDSYKNTSNHYV